MPRSSRSAFIRITCPCKIDQCGYSFDCLGVSVVSNVLFSVT